MEDLINRDLLCKNGPELNDESTNLTNIFLGRGKDLTLSWLKAMGQGDRDNIRPFQSKLLRRYVETAAVVWQNPPTRRLLVDGTPLPDSDPTVELVSEIYQRSQIDSYLKRIDRWRTLHGQTILYANPPRTLRPKRIPLRIFWPHSVLRDPDDTAQDDITQDRRIAFEIMHDPRQPTHSIYHYWVQEAPNDWRAYRVYRNGALVDDDINALYPGGIVPFGRPPFMVIYDELSEGRAWIPIDGTRSAFALASNVVLNDILFLLKQEAHSVVAITGVTNQNDMPKRWGPGEMWGFEDPEARAHLLALNPKLQESIAISRHILEVFASGEGLPGDYFLASRKYETGAAGKLRQQDLDARRQDQTQDAIETELELFELIRDLWNTYVPDESDPIGEEYELTVELGKQWFPMDLAELQKTYAFDLSIGACSIIDYIQERDKLTRVQAIDKYDRVQVDREAYVLRENPAALIAGRNNAGAPGSSSPMDPGGRPEVADGVEPDGSSMNPDRAASNEAGSVVGAARRALSLASD